MALVRTGYATLAGFPTTGASSIIYVDLSNGNEYTWNRTTYVAFVPTKVIIEEGVKSLAWFTANPTFLLGKGQRVNLDTQQGIYKIGDGITQLSALSFLGTPYTLTTAEIGGVINSANTGILADTGLVTTINSSVAEKNTWTQIKAFLKTYYDTIYTTTSAVASQISTALSGYATQAWVTSQGYVTSVITALLTGYIKGAGTISATDSVLTAIQKLDGNDDLKANLTDLVSVFITARNNTGATIPKGSLVYVTGAIGQNPTIALAKADAEATSFDIGMASFDIPNNTNVQNNVTIGGLISGINTSAFADGDILYLSFTTAGAFTNVPPVSPNFSQSVGVCLYSHITNGKVLVRTEVPLACNTTLSASNKIAPTSNAVKVNIDLKESFQTLTVTSTATPSITITGFNNTNYSITAQAVALTSLTIVGTPNNFDKLILRIKDNGTARALAFGASFIAGEALIPTTTKVSSPLTLIFIYDSVLSKYVCIFSSYDSGLWSLSTGEYSLKSVNDTPNVASGKYSVAMGDYATASGLGSMSFGSSSVSNSVSSFACGYNTHSYNAYSFSGGYNTFANGDTSFVFGYACQVNGNYGSMATGYQARANGAFGAFGAGYQAYADGESSQALGSQVQALDLGGHASGVLAISTERGEWARSGNGAIGQYGIVDWGKLTTDDTQVEVFIGATASKRLRIAVASAYRVNITGCAKDAVGNIIEFSSTVLIKNISGTTSLVGVPVITSTFADAGIAAAVIVLSADNTNDTLKVEVKGIAATNISWYIKGEYVKIK